MRKFMTSLILCAIFACSILISCDKEPEKIPFIPIPDKPETENPETEATMITPTIEPAQKGEDITGLRYWPGMQINVKDNAFFDARLKEVSEAGFKYVELKFKYAYGFEKMSDSQITDALARYQRKLTDAGIEIWSVHLPYDNSKWTNIGGEETIRRQSVDYLLRVLSLMSKEFPGCRNYVLHASKGVLSPRSESVAQARKSLEEMVPAATGYGVRLCVENLVGSLCPTPEEKGAVLDGIENVYSTYDIGHANCTGHNVVEFLEWEGTRLGTVHIHDTIFGSKNDDHRLVGLGNVNKWGEVYLTLLTKNLYRGVFMFEPSDDQSAKDVMATYNLVLSSYNLL